MPDQKIYTTGQIAKICKVSPRTVSKWFDSGKLPGYRIPGSLDRRVTRQQLVSFCTYYGFPLADLEMDTVQRVLCVGVGPVLCQQLIEILPDGECALLQVNSPFAAGYEFLRYNPQTIILDFSLSRGECQSIAWQVKHLRRDECIQVIGLTSEDECHIGSLLESGFTDCLIKPVDAVVLAKLILGQNNLLPRKQAVNGKSTRGGLKCPKKKSIG